MSNTNLKYLWLVILSVLWLTSAFPFIEKSSSPTYSISHTDASKSTKFNQFEINQKADQYFHASHVLWLSLLIDSLFDKKDCQLLPWPEQSQIKTFFEIISYQHYIASLRPIFSIN